MTASASPLGPVLKTADLTPGKPLPIRVEPDEAQLAELADEMGLLGLRKLRFEGRLSPLGKRDWRLTGHLGATVVQPCVITLAPVATRIEEEVARNWVSDFELPEGDEVELPESVEDEPLGAEIDVGAVLREALFLALPAWPRAEGAELETAQFTEPGKQAMSDEEARPFAGLAALRDRLTSGESEE